MPHVLGVSVQALWCPLFIPSTWKVKQSPEPPGKGEVSVKCSLGVGTLGNQLQAIALESDCVCETLPWIRRDQHSQCLLLSAAASLHISSVPGESLNEPFPGEM